jgi:hypothetical protein
MVDSIFRQPALAQDGFLLSGSRAAAGAEACMSFFLIQPGEVTQQVLPNCDHPVTLAVAANHVRGMLDSVPAAGEPQAQAALGEYLEVWSQTLALIATTAEGLQAALQASIASYVATDQSVAENLTTVGEQG